MQVIGTMVVIGLGAPIVLLVFIPLGFVYRLVMRYYLTTSRELKRLDAVSRSPIFSFFGETLSGLAVIRVSVPQVSSETMTYMSRGLARPNALSPIPKLELTEIKLVTCLP